MSSHIKLFSPPKKEKKKERKKKESYETQLRTEVIDIRWQRQSINTTQAGMVDCQYVVGKKVTLVMNSNKNQQKLVTSINVKNIVILMYIAQYTL